MYQFAQPLRLWFDASDFQGAMAWVNGHWTLFIDWDDLVMAAVTVGYPTLGAYGIPDPHQRWANRLREAIVYGYLRNRNGAVVRTDVFARADPSETRIPKWWLKTGQPQGPWGEPGLPGGYKGLENRSSCPTFPALTRDGSEHPGFLGILVSRSI